MRSVVIAAVCSVLMAGSAQAQRASVLLPQHHWAHEALRELEVRGAVGQESFDALTRTITVLSAVEAFQHAATFEDSVVAKRAAHYAQLLSDEYGEQPDAKARLAVDVGAGYLAHEGRVSVGIGYDATDWQGAIDRPDRAVGTGELGVFARSGAIAFGARGFSGGESTDVSDAQLLVRYRQLQLWAGRHAVGFGQTENGVVLSGNTPFDAAGFALANPIKVPSPFASGGRLFLEGFLTQLDRVNNTKHPFLAGARISYSFHPRATIAINRAAMFGGEGVPGITLSRLGRMFLGLYSGDGSNFENQVMSGEGRFRFDLGRLQPVVFLEWGMDDGAGAWRRVPGMNGGVMLPFEVNGNPLDVTIEHANFDGTCCGNPIWYRHFKYRGGWVAEGVPLAAGLGGHGNETNVLLRTALASGALRAHVRGYVRNRRAENLYSPEREGRSRGGEARIAWRVTSRLEATLDGAVEHGETDWSESRIAVGARWQALGNR